MVINVNEYLNKAPMGKPLTDVQAFFDGDDHYELPVDSKYHIGDSFEHPAGLTGVIYDITYSQRKVKYALKFLETSTKKEIRTALRMAWYSDAEIDDFIQTVDREFSWNYNR